MNDFEYAKKDDMPTRTNTKRYMFFIAFIVVILSALIGRSIIRNYRITNDLTNIAKSYGLKDVKIIIGGKISGYDFYSVTVDSSNLETFSYEKMYSLANAMHTDDAHISEYTSNGDCYLIYPSTRSIYKNGDTIHDDYWNSESYKETTKNNKDKANYTSQTDNSGQSSNKSYKFYHKTNDNDPYNAKDYSNEEDFYYDHYDDFFDYYDAENYYNEHTD